MLQTCPYITAVYPNSGSPVVYMTDTLGVEYPDISAPSLDSKYGIINLDRSVIWRENLEELKLLEYAAPKAVEENNLINKYGHKVVSELKFLGWLKKENDLCKEYFCHSVQIEITTHCNWACKFCPVSVSPKPKSVMNIDTFEDIVRKASVYKTIRFATFHFYNEPMLDPLFNDRIKILKKYNMKLTLSTNASALTKKKVDLLKNSNVVHVIWINLPSVEEDKFCNLTQSKSYKQCVRNIEYLATTGLPTRITVNGVGKEIKADTQGVINKFSELGIDVFHASTCDRAGALKDTKYDQGVFVPGRLSGCSWPLNHPYFAVNGDIFMCCNDYYQSERFGNIKDGSIHDLMTSERAVELRRKIFGVSNAPKNFLCRYCHDQTLSFVERQFRPLASFPLIKE